MNQPANNTANWRAIDRAHQLHPFSDTKALAEEGCRVITRAQDIYNLGQRSGHASHT